MLAAIGQLGLELPNAYAHVCAFSVEVEWPFGCHGQRLLDLEACAPHDLSADFDRDKIAADSECIYVQVIDVLAVIDPEV